MAEIIEGRNPVLGALKADCPLLFYYHFFYKVFGEFIAPDYLLVVYVAVLGNVLFVL